MQTTIIEGTNVNQTQWEYKVITLKPKSGLFKPTPDDDAIVAALNREGASGREMVDAVAVRQLRQVRLFLKRPR